MPFIVNGQKVNKPIYKGVILNAMHVWLQNHWTGTPNASTSTLSQDGAVVATNLSVDPNVLRQYGTWVDSGTTTAVKRPDGHWTYTPSSDAHGLAISIPIDSVAQDDYVYCEWSAGTVGAWVTGMDVVSNGAGWVLCKNTNSPGNRALYFQNPNGTPITMLKVGRYSAADYAAMQARGIKWFDGTTYTR